MKRIQVLQSEVRGIKIGPPEIRSKLNLALLCDMRFNPAMMAMCELLYQRGKAKMCAIGALIRKLAHWYL
ncbi:hypothetical protein VEE59_28950 [Escherichia coli]|nr:hypothetical protein VEE59_28950 [Escherichia coli]